MTRLNNQLEVTMSKQDEKGAKVAKASKKDKKAGKIEQTTMPGHIHVYPHTNDAIPETNMEHPTPTHKQETIIVKRKDVKGLHKALKNLKKATKKFDSKKKFKKHNITAFASGTLTICCGSAFPNVLPEDHKKMKTLLNDNYGNLVIPIT